MGIWYQTHCEDLSKCSHVNGYRRTILLTGKEIAISGEIGKGSATQIYYNKKGKKAKKREKGKKKGNLLYVLKEGRARTNPPLLPIPSLPFYFRLKESLSQK